MGRKKQMSEKATKTPQIRFDGYTDAWEQRKLGEISERVTRKNKDLESTLPLTISAQDGLIDQNEFFNKTVASRDVSGYYLMKNGEFAYNKSYSNGYPWGAVKRLDRYEMGVLSTLYIIFKPTKVNSTFLAKYYDTDNWYKEVSKHAAEGARNHGLLNIAASDFFKTELLIPSSIEEQAKIGDFFTDLDDLITLHQRECDLLAKMKKSYLQKMFPKNGEDKPEIRFDGYTDAWEQRKFFDNIKNTIDFRGRTPKKLGMDWSESGYLALSALNVKNGYIDPSADAHYGNQDLYDKWMVGKELYEGQVLFTTEAPMGNVAQVPDNNKYILSQRTIAFDVNSDKITNDFLAVLLRTPKSFNELSSLASGGTAKGVSQKSLSQFQVTLPKNLEEQKKIGTFFKQLDNTIALHQRELDSLKKMKKSLLQMMFV